MRVGALSEEEIVMDDCGYFLLYMSCTLRIAADGLLD